MRRLALWFLVACGSSTPAAPAGPATPMSAAVEVAADASVPDAGPSAELLAATPWIFRYNAPPRVETWTLRYAGTEAQLVVENAQGTQTYIGIATDGATLALTVATRTAKLALDCKRAHRGVGVTCKDKKPKAIDLLDCYHPDFKEPMTFAPSPGDEYSASCGGYQLLK